MSDPRPVSSESPDGPTPDPRAPDPHAPNPNGPNGPSGPIAPSRRRFLGAVAGAGTCALGAAVLAGPMTVAVAPAFDAEASAAGGWMKLGLLESFAVGAAPTRVVLRATTRDSWLVRENQPIGAVLVQRTADAEFRVFSARCPHLGCSVDWQGEAKAYVCPCHGAVFKDDGGLEPKADGGANPSPRALDTLEWRVSAGATKALEVRWVKFKANVAEKLPVGGA